MADPSIKLVGATVSCEDCGMNLVRCAKFLHVESPVLATDAVGLALLLKRWTVYPRGMRFGKWDEIWGNEVGATDAIRDAGFNFAPLERFWKGHDFRNLTLTQLKCQALTNASARRISAVDRKIKPRDADGSETNLHAWYLSRGGVNCKGCYWGMDLPPLESMFVHYYSSPSFNHGAVRAYVEMEEVLHSMLDRGSELIVSDDTHPYTHVSFENGTLVVQVPASPRSSETDAGSTSR